MELKIFETKELDHLIDLWSIGHGFMTSYKPDALGNHTVLYGETTFFITHNTWVKWQEWKKNLFKH